MHRPFPWGFALGVWLLPFLLLATFPLLVAFHADIGWHLETGRVYREVGEITQVNPFSWTNEAPWPIAPWVNTAWGFSLVTSLIDEKLGFHWLVALFICIGATIPALGFIHAVRRGASPLAAAIVGLLVGITLPTYALPDIVIGIAGQTVSLLYAALFHLLAFELLTGERGGKIAFAVTAPVAVLLWNNSHGAWITGYLILGAWLVDAALRRDRDGLAATGFAITGGLALLPLNPYGLHVFDAVRQTMNFKANISEWFPFREASNTLGMIHFLLFLQLAPWILPRARWSERLLCGFWLFMGYRELRHYSQLMVFSAPVLALGLDAVLDRIAVWRQWSTQLTGSGPVARRMALAGFALCILGIGPLLANRSGYAQGDPYYPTRQVALLQERWPTARLLNDWNFGGFIIHATGGAHKVFIDGRAGSAYDLALLEDYTRWMALQDPGDLLKKYDVEVIMLASFRGHVHGWLADHPEWIKVMDEPSGVLYVRNDVLDVRGSAP